MSYETDETSALQDLPLWADEEAHAILKAVCSEKKVPIEVIAELVALQRERQHQERAHGIHLRFEEILGIM